MTTVEPSVCIAIDRGGTFTDIYAQIHRANPVAPDNSLVEHQVLKLLSVDPRNYADAPTEGIRRVLEMATGRPFPKGRPLDTASIQYIRMGTTIATNALLERDGEPCALVTTVGFKNILDIGNQARPDIFDLKVAKRPPLNEAVVQVHERVIVDNSQTHSVVKVRQPLDEVRLTEDLRRLREQGYASLAVALMHSYAFEHHEEKVRDIALTLGFTHVSLSCKLTPMVKIVPRAFTATVDAYLTPKIRAYITKFRTSFSDQLHNTDVQFMQSDGGLCDIHSFHGYVAILSGPAGGVVGYARTAYGFEQQAPERKNREPLPIIGFDMGGTSTDVSRYAGTYEHVFETQTAGVIIQAPQLDINTVAAGGGSRLFFRSGMFYVGPQSAGAHPGPVCYRKGGYLTVTDANLLLGRIEPSLFPHIFGENADLPLDVVTTQHAFDELTATINEYLTAMGDSPLSREDVADGFVRVANEAMCRPVRELTEAKGHDVRNHGLACFGGAGGQHACAVARSLGIETVVVHKYSGVLSAYGIAMADSVFESQQPIDVPYADVTSREKALSQLELLKEQAEDSLRDRGFTDETICSDVYLNLRYDGTDFAIMVPCPKDQIDDIRSVQFDALFVGMYSQEHGFHIPEKRIIIDDIRVRALGMSVTESADDLENVNIPAIELDEDGTPLRNVGNTKPSLSSKCYFTEEGGWLPIDIWRTQDLPYGDAVLPGPCIIVDSQAGNTIVIDPGCVARVSSDGNILINVGAKAKPIEKAKVVQSGKIDHVMLSIYSHRFMGIAEQMGRTLQRTSLSTNIKERLDFSCAIFDETGGLVANAPHIPVHLGAMQYAVRFQIEMLGDDWKEGEVLLSNHPAVGGSHLPDITVITPVYHHGKVIFYVASRGHHADVGGATPGSMPPFSKRLSDEGLAVRSMKLVKNGLFQEKELIHRLEEAGCRCIRDVISDLRAQVAANKNGINLVSDLVASEGLYTVIVYMHHLQDAAAQAVREMLKNTTKRINLTKGQPLIFKDCMDDGTAISLSLDIDGEKGTALFDFSGTGPQVEGNTNAPRAITSSAIIYALRCLLDDDIPLNQGCLKPITVNIPEGTVLSAEEEAAVVGGNVLTSQRVTDVIFGAFRACAASQGCMNNFTFGDEKMGFYETIGGGCGAGPGWKGTSGVQCHMTNTRITDAEIMERRYPVVVHEFSIRDGSGGQGKWTGGDGLVRALEFKRKLTVCMLTERRDRQPYGLEGGQNGAAGVNEVIRVDGEHEVLEGKSTITVYPGDVVKINTPGGGGYGKMSA